MRVVGLRTRRFRNLAAQKVSFSSEMNLITGENGSGKTNFLEALNCLCGWGPFSAGRWSELTCWEENGAFELVGSFDGESGGTVQVLCASRPSLRLDGDRATWTDVRLFAPCLSFLPAHMALIEGGPVVRRRFLDVGTALLYPLYARRLSDWRRLVRHKRYLLRLGKPGDVADRIMKPLAGWLWLKREEFVGALQRELDAQADLLSCPVQIGLHRGGGGACFDPEEDFAAGLERLGPAERKSGLPLVGPHRDDLTLPVSERRAIDYFSRGQRRRAALALILAAGGAVKSQLGRSPILLIDEVASELDELGRQKVVQALGQSGCQVFAATAEPQSLDWPGDRFVMRQGSAEKL